MDGLINAFAMKPDGTSRELSNADEALAEGEWRWLHFERTSTGTETWLRQSSGLDPLVVDSLLLEETRPRGTEFEDSSLVNLRGVNMNEDAAAHDMISLRCYVSRHLVITLRRDFIFAVQDVRDRYEMGLGPHTPFALLAQIAGGMTRRIASIVMSIEDELDAIEEKVIDTPDGRNRAALLDLRRRVIALKRFLAPQRTALVQLAETKLEFMGKRSRAAFHECADQTTRLVEVLDSMRERSGLISEEMAANLADRMNRNTYALSLVAAIFLPLGFLTGLLGINVGGMPGMENGAAFWVVVGLCVVLAFGVIYVLRRMRLM